MALTRAMLKAMGIEDEKIDQIIDEHSETVDALKQQRDEFKAKADELDGTKKKLSEVESQLEQANPYKAKYEESQKQLEDLKANVATEKDRAKRETAYRGLLKDAGISEKRIDSVLRITDLSSLEFDDDGALKDTDALKESITKEWADFITTEGTRGAQVDNPPAGGAPTMTKDQINAIKDPVERQAAMAENIDLYN